MGASGITLVYKSYSDVLPIYSCKFAAYIQNTFS